MKSSMLLTHERCIFYSVVVASIFFSLWIYLRTSIINPDGVCYVLSAKQFDTAGLKAAMGLCGQAKWPFYSFLIYLLAHACHLSYTTAAYLCNALFSAFSAVLFVAIIKELGGNRRTLWLACLAILCAHQFMNLRADIIRDHGFWAFYLLSIWSLLRFIHKPSFWVGFFWNASLLLASLFRIEGVVFLLLVPFATLFYVRYPMRQRLHLFATLNLPTLCLIVVGAFYFVLFSDQLIKITRAPEIFYQMKNASELMTQHFFLVQNVLEKYIIGPHANSSFVVASIFLSAWYFTNVIANFSLIYLLLIIYAFKRRLLSNLSIATDHIGVIKNRNYENIFILFSYIFVNVLITGVFFSENLFLSSRYLIALTLVLMLWIPFALDDLIERAYQSMAYRLVLAVSIILLLGSALGIFVDFGERKGFIKDAGLWLAKNVPANANLYTNNQRIMYYSGLFDNNLFELFEKYQHVETISNQRWKNYDYIALRLNHKKPREALAILQQIHLLPTQVFSNKYGDSVVIYKVSQ